MKTHVIQWMSKEETERLLKELNMSPLSNRDKGAAAKAEGEPQTLSLPRAQSVEAAKLQVESL